ncbi:MAG: hypothetical protein HOV77_21525 [Hamadaea sp.]|uniref:hypothetical protein n=1 Tax=Hamadaea sp. TaxID=2024425 RepID=UPI0018288CA7|nr:hypothetical protein [Hamadaea sp.]NUT21765.1 hypothetical protein [Hamadaea sp.]
MIRLLLRLYPRRWRARYGAELDDLVGRLLADGHSHPRVAADLARGAVDAHLRNGADMLRSYRFAAGLGLIYGLAVGAILATVFYLGNITFATTEDTDGLNVLIGWLAVLGLLGLAGWQAGRRPGGRYAPLVAGAIAGLVVAAAIVATFAFLDNVYLDVIGRQEQKIAALANAGGGDMRTFLNHEVIRMTYVLIPALTAIGAGLGAAGGVLARNALPSRR